MKIRASLTDRSIINRPDSEEVYYVVHVLFTRNDRGYNFKTSISHRFGREIRFADGRSSEKMICRRDADYNLEFDYFFSPRNILLMQEYLNVCILANDN